MSLLAPLDLDSLLASGHVSAVNNVGERRLHRRKTNRLCHITEADIPLTPAGSPDSDATFVTIPDILISEATLRYLGYNADTASKFWLEWTNWVARSVYSDKPLDSGLEKPFIDFARGHLTLGGCNAWTEDDQEWKDCMKACGISEELQEAIIDPVFNYIRFDRSCVDWLDDTLELRYGSLGEIRKTSQERETALRSTATRSGSGISSQL